MANPLNGMTTNGTNPLAGMAGMQINPVMLQKVSRIMQMVQKGADINTVITQFKKEGISPQVAEQALCVAFPQIKQIKQQMAQSGMNPQQFLNQVMQQNNVTTEQLNQKMAGLGDFLKG